MSKRVAFTGIPPMVPETSEAPTTSPPAASPQTPKKKRTRKPRFRYLLGYYITPSACVRRLLDKGVAVTGSSPDRECRAFRDVCTRLSPLGFTLWGPRFIDIDLPTETGYLLILATSYVKGQMLDVDEGFKRKVRFSVIFLCKILLT
jgi:hypothetical protein